MDLVRRAIRQPIEESDVPRERLRREVGRLRTRLEGVRARGGRYADVQMSPDVRMLVARLDAGAALSTLVH
jgi:hypothetical protein